MVKNKREPISFLPGSNPISKRRLPRKERVWQYLSDSVVELSGKYPFKWPSVFNGIKRYSNPAFNGFEKK